MKTTIEQNPNDLRILIPYFCYCCANGSYKVSDKAYEKFQSTQMKTAVSTDSVKSNFELFKEDILNPNEFWNTINQILHNLQNEYEKPISKMIINSIKRLISLTAKELNLNEQKSLITTNLIINNLSDYNLFIQNLYNSIESSTELVFLTYGKKKNKTFCLISETDEKVEPITEIMISQVHNYWNTKSFKI